MTERDIGKAGRPARLRTRLALVFAIFALNVVCLLALVQVWLIEGAHPGQGSAALFPLLLAGGVVVALAALGGWFIAAPLARPMERWAQAADRIGLGERDVSFPQSGGSHELARVSAALQSMFARVTEKEDALQERVRERTAALTEATDALAAERARLSDALEGSRLAYWDLDLHTGDIRLSAEWSRMLGEPGGETLCTVQELLERVPEEEHDRISAKVFAALKDGPGHYDVDHRVRRADGTYVWVRSRGRVTARGPDGRALRMAGTNVDVGARKAEEERLREVEARLQELLHGIDAIVCHVDLTGRILFANRRYHEFHALPAGSAVGQSVRDISGDEGASAFERSLPQLLCGNEVRYERDARVQNRTVRIQMRLVPHRDALGVTDSVYAVLVEAGGRKDAERILERQAYTDPVTGLPNRRLFIEQLERGLLHARRGASRTAVLYADLDGFAAVNDSLGHDGGNALLRQAGARFVAAVRGGDTVSYLERDEYAVLIEGCRSIEDAEVVARKLVDSLQAPFTLPQGEVQVQCSIGIALAPADGDEPELLLRNAEKAVSRARKATSTRYART